LRVAAQPSYRTEVASVEKHNWWTCRPAWSMRVMTFQQWASYVRGLSEPARRALYARTWPDEVIADALGGEVLS
jgi:hypothetical protein